MEDTAHRRLSNNMVATTRMSDRCSIAVQILIVSVPRGTMATNRPLLLRGPRMDTNNLRIHSSLMATNRLVL